VKTVELGYSYQRWIACPIPVFVYKYSCHIFVDHVQLEYDIFYSWFLSPQAERMSVYESRSLPNVQLEYDILVLEDLWSRGPWKRVGIFVGSPATQPLNKFMYSIFVEKVASTVQ
jgi:hypothetical protein